jgi:cytochrome c553
MQSMRHALFLNCSLAAVSAFLQPAADASGGNDLASGERLLVEHRCAACHAETMGGDGASIYRPGDRIGTPAALRAMVERCSAPPGWACSRKRCRPSPPC